MRGSKSGKFSVSGELNKIKTILEDSEYELCRDDSKIKEKIHDYKLRMNDIKEEFKKESLGVGP